RLGRGLEPSARPPAASASAQPGRLVPPVTVGDTGSQGESRHFPSVFAGFLCTYLPVGRTRKSVIDNRQQIAIVSDRPVGWYYIAGSKVLYLVVNKLSAFLFVCRGCKLGFFRLSFLNL